MSKSTPLSQLNSNEIPEDQELSGGNAYDEKENQLVSEILTEINNESGNDTQNLMMELNDNVESSMPPPNYTSQKPQLEFEPVPVPESELTGEQLSKEFSLDEDEQSRETSLKSVQEEIISRIKMPLLAGALVVLFCTPQVTKVISKLVPPKELFQKNKTLFILLAKFILSSITFTAIQFAV